MAGYSGTPLVRKLGIKPGHRVALLQAPAGFEEMLEGLPAGVRLRRETARAGLLDVIVLFASTVADLKAGFEPAVRRLEPNGGVWVAWPKRASGVVTDLTEDRVRAIGLAAGVVDNKVCAIDETWSGLRFVVRLADRS